MSAAKFLETAMTLTLNVPCGCLAPTFLIGAGVGRAFGELVTGDDSPLNLEFDGGDLEPSDFAAAGAAAFVGGVTGTVSISVIVFELTNQIHFSLPLLVSVLAARYVASLLGDTIYSTVLRLGKLPNLPRETTDGQLLEIRQILSPHHRLTTHAKTSGGQTPLGDRLV